MVSGRVEHAWGGGGPHWGGCFSAIKHLSLHLHIILTSSFTSSHFCFYHDWLSFSVQGLNGLEPRGHQGAPQFDQPARTRRKMTNDQVGKIPQGRRYDSHCCVLQAFNFTSCYFLIVISHYAICSLFLCLINDFHGLLSHKWGNKILVKSSLFI